MKTHRLPTLLFLLALSVSAVAAAQVGATEEPDGSLLTLDRIFTECEFKTERTPRLRWLDDGSHYTTLEESEAFPERFDIVRHNAADGSNAILVVDRATKKVTRVTPKSEDAYKEILAWHPDGDRISYMYYNSEDGNGSRIVSLETSQISDLVDMPEPMWDYVGIWGPDKRYYFRSVVRGYAGSWGLYAFDLKSRKYEEIRQFPIKSVSLPTWSADGHLMVWSEKEPVRQLWMMTNYE